SRWPVSSNCNLASIGCRACRSEEGRPVGSSGTQGSMFTFLIRYRAFSVAFLLISAVADPVATAIAAGGPKPLSTTAPAESADFNIPAQPLEDALITYATVTGVEVFVDHALISGRRSSPLRGVYGFEAGLRQLLTGSGLDLRRGAAHAYTLVVPPSLQEPPIGQPPSWMADDRQ